VAPTHREDLGSIVEAQIAEPSRSPSRPRPSPIAISGDPILLGALRVVPQVRPGFPEERASPSRDRGAHMSRRFRIEVVPRVAAAAMLAAALNLAGCTTHRTETKALQAPARVRLARVEIAGSPATPILAARVRAAEEVTLAATVRARLTVLPFREGASFRAGEMLARFESPEARLELSAARATRLAAEARRAETRRQEARFDSLLRAGVLARRDLDVAASDARAAEAALEEARAREAVLEAGLQIPAPFDGVVVRHVVDPGAHLEPGAPVLVIRSHAGHEIEVALPESEVERVHGREPWYRTGGGAWRAARLLRLEGMTDYASRSRVAFLSAPNLDALEPGTYVEVRFQDSKAGAGPSASAAPASEAPPSPRFVIPATSVVRRGALTGVFVAHEGRARLRWLRLGPSEGDRIEVLAGLWAGEEIVRDPQGLQDGRAIEVMP
jgi:RND family efflux transporter MFP subunit